VRLREARWRLVEGQTRSARFRLASLVLATPSAIPGSGLLWSLSFDKASTDLTLRYFVAFTTMSVRSSF